MHDLHVPCPTPPEGWHQALSALPLETPDGDGWPRLASRLPLKGGMSSAAPPSTHAPRRGHARRRRGWLSAAAVAALAAIAALPALRTGALDDGASQPTTVSSALPVPAASIAQAPPEVRDARPTDHAIAAMTAEAVTPPAGGSGARSRVPAQATPAQRPVAHVPDLADESAGVPTGEAFDRLYAESARLESMIALVGDAGMASATGAFIAATLEARVEDIDLSLAQADLLPDQRLRLWDARVAVLRELAATEVAQRMVALEGGPLDMALVRID